MFTSKYVGYELSIAWPHDELTVYQLLISDWKCIVNIALTTWPDVTKVQVPTCTWVIYHLSPCRKQLSVSTQISIYFWKLDLDLSRLLGELFYSWCVRDSLQISFFCADSMKALSYEHHELLPLSVVHKYLQPALFLFCNGNLWFTEFISEEQTRINPDLNDGSFQTLFSISWNCCCQ